MEVRDAWAEDLLAINEIENEAIRSGFAHFGLEDVPLHETEQAWHGGKERYPWLVAVEADRVVGFARAGGWKARDAYARTCEIGLYISPEAQGRGVGTALYDLLIPRLQEKNFHTVLAGIALPNDPSVRLHEKFAFRHVGTLPEVGYKLGKWRSVGYWARGLSQNGEAV